jgi:hypothetical protein
VDVKRALFVFAQAVALAVACSRAPSPSAFVVIDAPEGGELDVAKARVLGSGVRKLVVSNGKLVVERDSRDHSALTIDVEGACPLDVDGAELAPGRTTRHTLVPWFSFGKPTPELGFFVRFDIVARPGCDAAATTAIEWKQTDGRLLTDLRIDENGRRLSAVLPSLESLLKRRPAWGIVPVTPSTRGEVELRATWSHAGHTGSRVLRLAAAARSRGLPNVAVNTRLYLAGDGFHVVSAPEGSSAVVSNAGELMAFTPDRSGVFMLADARGKTLRLFAGRYDDTPLDCGRSDCHADIAQSSRSNPMTTILQRGLDGPFAGDYPACALACHAVGEPGIDDGGFTAVAARLHLSPADMRRSGFHDLPAPLQRLGGVGCLACHGPGTVAEPGGRDALLRVDVCATCHDASPRYGHVEAWQSSRMARSDADLRTHDAPCARCHTTWGFLGEEARKPDDGALPVGISCAACHAVHPTRAAAGSVIGATCTAALRRETPRPALLEGALAASADKSAACLSCHAPDPSDGQPAASAAVIWAGRGGVDPKTGAALVGPAPHAAIAGGCIGCHRSGPEGLGRGAEHGFAATADACEPCHADKKDPQIRSRALSLWMSATKSTTDTIESPLHANDRRLDRATPRGRALWNVALVLEDPAADRHDAAYARILLDAAARVLAPGARDGL